MWLSINTFISLSKYLFAPLENIFLSNYKVNMCKLRICPKYYFWMLHQLNLKKVTCLSVDCSVSDCDLLLGRAVCVTIFLLQTSDKELWHHNAPRLSVVSSFHDVFLNQIYFAWDYTKILKIYQNPCKRKSFTETKLNRLTSLKSK